MHHAFIDQFSHLKSPLHQLDPRAKIASFFFFVLLVVMTTTADYLAFALFFALISAMLLVSTVPLSYVLRHSLLVLPFALIAGISLLLMKGDAGLAMFISVLIKSWLSVLAMLTLVSTTRFPALLKGLEWFRVPALVLMVISFMYRYFFLINDEMMRMQAARDSRGAPSKLVENISSAGSMIGSLFVRSYERAESAFLAMCARGFDGEMKALCVFNPGVWDFVFIILFCSCALVIKLFG